MSASRLVGPSLVGHLNDQGWLGALQASIDDPEVEGLRFPLFPEEETQRNFVGTSGADALVDAVHFVRYTLNSMAWVGMAPGPDRTVIDFGCGWGRITRALLHSFEPDHVIGVDPLGSMVEACRTWFTPSEVRFETIDNWPPLPFPSDSVDVIVAFSVFSHLPERLATAWMAEFLRVLKPGGIVVGTTQSRSFIALCEQTRNDPQYQGSEFLWHQWLARSFLDPDDAARRFDAGEFLHEANGGGDELAATLYGDSLFGPTFVEQRWSHLLEPVRFDDKPCGLPQACFVLGKRDRGTPARGRWPARIKIRASPVTSRFRADGAATARRLGRAARHPSLVVRRIRWARTDAPPAQPAGRPLPADPPAAAAVGHPAGDPAWFAPYEHPGFCPACDQETVFDVVQPWLRDGYLCRRCGSIPRERALAHVLRRLRPDFAELVIHESSPEWRGISRYLREHCPGYIASYCRPGQPLGIQIDGYRNEDLERLTFDDASIDVHVSQDVLEHIFDLDAAQHQIERTLRPGGLHVFTTPMVNKAQPTSRRALLGPDGEIVHLAEPVFHGNPIDADGSLVTYDFGFDLPGLIDRATDLTTTVYEIDDLSLGIRAEYIEVGVSAKANATAAAPTP